MDLGVQQDGLVHVSAMSTKFISDPRELVQSGQIVKVKVLDVDVPRKRISLTLRLDDEVGGGRAERGGGARGGEERRRGSEGGQPREGGAPRQGGQKGSGQPRGAGQRGSDQKGSGQRGADQRRGGPGPAPADTALADALRRAGLAR